MYGVNLFELNCRGNSQANEIFYFRKVKIHLSKFKLYSATYLSLTPTLLQCADYL